MMTGVVMLKDLIVLRSAIEQDAACWRIFHAFPFMNAHKVIVLLQF